MYSLNSEPFKLEREVEAIVVPSGESLNLPGGTVGYITQSLGGSFTVFIDGSMFMILGHNADALGKEPMAMPDINDNASLKEVEEAVWKQLENVYDPEIPVNIEELGLVYECNVSESESKFNVDIKMTLTAAGCGMGDVLVSDARTKIKLIPNVSEVKCEIVFDPPWDKEMMSDAARLETGMF